MKAIETMVIAVGGRGDRIATDLKKRGFDTSKVFLEIKSKPIITRLIEMALRAGFTRVFILVSHYETDFRTYFEKLYSDDSRVIPVYGGANGKKWGVPWHLYHIRNKLTSPFVYSDGNILYSSVILNKLRLGGEETIHIALSKKDHALTHSRVVMTRRRIHSIDTRLALAAADPKRVNGTLTSYFSIGLMRLQPKIFSIIPKFAYKKDLDYVVSEAFAGNLCPVGSTIYSGKWLSVHTIHDIDKFNLDC